MSKQWLGPQPRPVYAELNQLPAAGDWFEVYEVAEDYFVFYEPRHCEETISNLVIGRDKAALIDTGCGNRLKEYSFGNFGILASH